MNTTFWQKQNYIDVGWSIFPPAPSEFKVKLCYLKTDECTAEKAIPVEDNQLLPLVFQTTIQDLDVGEYEFSVTAYYDGNFTGTSTAVFTLEAKRPQELTVNTTFWHKRHSIDVGWSIFLPAPSEFRVKVCILDSSDCTAEKTIPVKDGQLSSLVFKTTFEDLDEGEYELSVTSYYDGNFTGTSTTVFTLEMEQSSKAAIGVGLGIFFAVVVLFGVMAAIFIKLGYGRKLQQKIIRSNQINSSSRRPD
ncbi:uncharacterized protein [Watersipora subatra]|uniref:uncharacterized protein n=1 Tax=Watersipora subatra TaxID=2589382 RepID=UPI00355B6E17